MPTSHLATAAMGFAIIVTAICPVLATMPLDIGMECVELAVDILVGISNDSSNLHVRQQLIVIRYQNRFVSSSQ